MIDQRMLDAIRRAADRLTFQPPQLRTQFATKQQVLVRQALVVDTEVAAAALRFVPAAVRLLEAATGDMFQGTEPRHVLSALVEGMEGVAANVDAAQKAADKAARFKADGGGCP